MGNSTTIEGWEKDKVATLVRRGKIAEIKYPYVSFMTGSWLMREYRFDTQSQVCSRTKSIIMAVASTNARGRTVFPGQSGSRG